MSRKRKWYVRQLCQDEDRTLISKQNRLLQMIRAQQDQINTLQGPHQASDAANTSSAIDEAPSPHRENLPPQPLRSVSSSSVNQTPRSPLQRPSMSRNSSRGIPPLDSNTSSPSLRPISSNIGHDEWSMGGTRDDSAFYQAETQTLQRENQMLKHRIRELGESSFQDYMSLADMKCAERQVLELNVQPNAASSNTGV